MNSEEEAEAAEDGAENDGDDFTCVTPQRAQGRQGVSPPPRAAVDVLYLLNTPGDLQEKSQR